MPEFLTIETEYPDLRLLIRQDGSVMFQLADNPTPIHVGRLFPMEYLEVAAVADQNALYAQLVENGKYSKPEWRRPS